MATMVKTMASAFFLLVALLAFADYASAKVYKVGDGNGWTILGNVNYTAWASSKNFHVGDTIVFEYSKQFHSVLEVNRADYRSCNTASPIATYKTGNDSILMRRGGHHFFICGTPGHCAAGQRVDIRIPKFPRPTMAPSVSPSASAPTNSGRSSVSPSESPSSSAPTNSGRSFVSPSESPSSVAAPASCFGPVPSTPSESPSSVAAPVPSTPSDTPSESPSSVAAPSEGLHKPLAIFAVAVAAYYAL